MDINFSEDRSLRQASALGMVAICVIALFHINSIYHTVGPATVLWLYDVTLVLFALAGAALALILWRSFVRGEILRAIWGSMGLGLLLWATGEIIWAFYELTAQQDLPYPSVADIAFAIGYIPLFSALVLRYRSLRTRPSSGWLVSAWLAFAVLVALAIVFVFGPIVTYPDYERPIEKFLGVLYPLGDLALALGVLLIVLSLTGGALSIPWALIAVGFMVVSVSDLLFTYATWNEIYMAGPDSGTNLITALSDVPYYASYVFIAFGLYMQARLQRVV
jgi:hypothetical protein